MGFFAWLPKNLSLQLSYLLAKTSSAKNSISSIHHLNYVNEAESKYSYKESYSR